MESIFHKDLLSKADKRLKKMLSILQEGILKSLDSLNPKQLVKDQVSRNNAILTIKGNNFNLDNYSNVFILGAGKASVGIASELVPILGKYYTRGILNILPEQINETIPKTVLNEAQHPIPNKNGFYGSKKQLELLKTAIKSDLILVIITGGASSLLTIPHPGIPFSDLKRTYELLLFSGMNIQQINAIRKHISDIKGGRLNKHTTADIIGLYVSDVLGDNLTDIGSGPTVKDPTTFLDCKNYLEYAKIWSVIPSSVKLFIKKGITEKNLDTPKDYPKSHTVHNILLGANYIALNVLRNTFEKYDIPTLVVSHQFSGESSVIGKFLAKYQLFPYFGTPKVLIFGGESTVTFSYKTKKRKPIGGRNQELVLSWMIEVATEIKTQKLAKPDILIVSFGTDGIDGYSIHAGALGVPQAWAITSQQLRKWKELLNSHESTKGLTSMNCITTGSTGANVADIIIAINF